MISGTHAETDGCAAKEAAKDDNVAASRGGVSRSHDAVQEETNERKGQTAEQVCPDVDGLVVQPEQGLERSQVRVGGLAVTGQDISIVASPGGKLVPENEQSVLDFGFDFLDLGHQGIGGRCGRPALPEL